MEEKEVDLRDYIRVIRKRKKVILLIFFIAVVASAVVSFSLPSVYKATLAIKIGDIINVDTLEKELIETPITTSQFLKGPQTLEKTIKDLKLSYSLGEFRKKVSVEQVRETEDLVQIEAEVSNPSEAVNIVNYLANELLERHKEIKRLYENKKDILARYDEQIKDINTELDGIEESKKGILAGYDEQTRDINKELDEIEEGKKEILARYDEQIRDINKELDEIEESKKGIVAGYDENIQSINSQLTSSKNEIDNLKKEMVELEIEREALSNEIEKKMEGPESLSEAEANILVGRLEDIRNRLVSCRSDIAGRQQQHDNFLGKLGETQLRRTEFEETKDQRYDNLLGELRRIEQEKTKFQETKEERYDTLTGELRRIEQEKTKFQGTKEERYDALTGELRQAQMEKTKLERVDSIKMYNTEILVTSEEPKTPIKPNKLLNILVTAVISLIVGLGLAFSLEYFEKTE